MQRPVMLDFLNQLALRMADPYGAALKQAISELDRYEMLRKPSTSRIIDICRGSRAGEWIVMDHSYRIAETTWGPGPWFLAIDHGRLADLVEIAAVSGVMVCFPPLLPLE